MLATALSWFGARTPAAILPLPIDQDFAPAPIIALPPPAPEPERLWDLHAISPRRFATVTHDLYMSGLLTWEQYCRIGFPSELHPAYDATIGALTGEKAQPDRPRDMLAELEQRLEFERRYSANDKQVRRLERTIETLRHHRHGFIPERD